MINTTEFSQLLLNWYDHLGRKDLPWRQNITPYRVWISEIMLQQTQVKTVVPYFLRFMQALPSLQHLADAEEDQILHLWAGLGYYSRARNMHRAAKTIIEQHAGKLPDSLTGLQSLPGIGKSTAGAILAIAMNKPAPILDGNVKRILARYHALSGSLLSRAALDKLWYLAEHYTPLARVGDYTQAIMDLGATLCTRTRPNCLDCPLTNDCRAYQLGRPTAFPEPKISKKKPVRAIRMLIFYELQQQAVLLEKRPPVGVWGGLWSFPECSLDVDLRKWCQNQYDIDVINYQELPAFKHIFTHFQLNITPLLIAYSEGLRRVMDSSQQVWYKLHSAQRLGFASPVKRLLEQLSTKAQSNTH